MIAILMLSITVSEPSVLAANPLTDMKKEKKQIEQKKNDLKSTIDKKKEEITNKKTKSEELTGKISTMNVQIDKTKTNIEQVTTEITQTNTEIEELQVSIVELEKKIAERDVVLRERVRAMQVKGTSVSYIDVLLGANSFSDFIDRFSAVNTLMDADRSIMEQQSQDKEQLEKDKILVEEKLATQEKNKKDLESMKVSLESKRVEMNGLVDALEDEQAKLAKEKGQLEEELHEVHEISAELEAQIVQEQNRIAELARKAEEQRKAAAAAAGGSSGGASDNLPAMSSGTWTKPTTGRLASPFGWRMHPIHHVQKQHRGMDISNAVGTPVVAAGDGIVSVARPFSTYGNFISITHSVNGQIFTTAYAHLSQIGVSVGQSVEKGQFIGKMGATGAVTGSHLHFEFHVGGWSASGASAVNPLRYVSF